MRKPDTIEAEINQIRLQIYERTKHMTQEQRVEYDRKRGEELAKKYGFKLVDSARERPNTP